jgi:hypothetical protein
VLRLSCLRGEIGEPSAGGIAKAIARQHPQPPPAAIVLSACLQVTVYPHESRCHFAKIPVMRVMLCEYNLSLRRVREHAPQVLPDAQGMSATAACDEDYLPLT